MAVNAFSKDYYLHQKLALSEGMLDDLKRACPDKVRMEICTALVAEIIGESAIDLSSPSTLTADTEQFKGVEGLLKSVEEYRLFFTESSSDHTFRETALSQLRSLKTALKTESFTKEKFDAQAMLFKEAMDNLNKQDYEGALTKSFEITDPIIADRVISSTVRIYKERGFVIEAAAITCYIKSPDVRFCVLEECDLLEKKW